MESQDTAANAGEAVKIVLAGKCGAGKTTLLATLLGLPKDSIKMTAKADTKSAQYWRTTRNGVDLIIIDTPGYEEGFKDLPIISEYDVLLYCLPVAPSVKFHDSNPIIMKELQVKCGKNIWKHCVVALTFSNTVCKKKDYKTYIKEFMTEFKLRLKEIGVRDIEVKSILEQHPDSKTIDIVAIPAGDEPNDEVLPPEVTLHEESDGWVDEIFFEILRKCKRREELAEFRYGSEKGSRILILLKLIEGTLAAKAVSSVLDNSSAGGK